MDTIIKTEPKMNRRTALAWVLENCDMPENVRNSIAKLSEATIKQYEAQKEAAKEPNQELIGIDKAVLAWAAKQAELFSSTDVRDAFPLEVGTAQKAIKSLGRLKDAGAIERVCVNTKVLWRVISKGDSDAE